MNIKDLQPLTGFSLEGTQPTGKISRLSWLPSNNGKRTANMHKQFKLTLQMNPPCFSFSFRSVAEKVAVRFCETWPWTYPFYSSEKPLTRLIDWH